MIEHIVEIPEGVEVKIDGDNVKGYHISVKGDNGENSKKLKYRGISVVKENSTIRVFAENTKDYKAMVRTYASHINNLIIGVTQGFKYNLKVVHSHFPIKVKVEGRDVIIENFLGEKYRRKSKIVGRVDVKVSGTDITITGIDKEECGQTAANLEQTTKIKNLDTRVFQDGIYIVK